MIRVAAETGALRRATVILCVALLASVGAAVAQGRRTAEPPSLFRPGAQSTVADLEIAETRHDRTGARRQPVTDLALRLHPRPGLPLSVALGLESGDQRLKGRPIFDVELMIVAGGRLHIEAGAACTGWVGDAALCRATCDGGLFALVREPAAGRLGLRLKIGRIPDAAADTVADGVRLGACADDPAGQRTLQPRSGLRLATLALEGE